MQGGVPSWAPDVPLASRLLLRRDSWPGHPHSPLHPHSPQQSHFSPAFSFSLAPSLPGVLSLPRTLSFPGTLVAPGVGTPAGNPGGPTSARRILRKAFAMAGSRPMRSKLRLFFRSASRNGLHLSSTSLTSPSGGLMATEKPCRKRSMSHCVAADISGPRDEYAPPYWKVLVCKRGGGRGGSLGLPPIKHGRRREEGDKRSLHGDKSVQRSTFSWGAAEKSLHFSERPCHRALGSSALQGGEGAHPRWPLRPLRFEAFASARHSGHFRPPPSAP